MQVAIALPCPHTLAPKDHLVLLACMQRSFARDVGRDALEAGHRVEREMRRMTNACDCHKEQPNRPLVITSINHHTFKGETLPTQVEICTAELCMRIYTYYVNAVSIVTVVSVLFSLHPLCLLIEAQHLLRVSLHWGSRGAHYTCYSVYLLVQTNLRLVNRNSPCELRIDAHGK